MNGIEFVDLVAVRMHWPTGFYMVCSTGQNWTLGFVWNSLHIAMEWVGLQVQFRKVYVIVAFFLKLHIVRI